MRHIVRTLLGILAAGTAGILPMAAGAQSAYPNKPIHIILGVAPGGLIDVSARLAASYLAPRLGQPVLIENRAGAATTIAANAVLKATPDGYTFFYGGAMSASPIFVKNGGVDFVTQMKPVSLLLSAPFYLLVNKNVAAKTMQELVAYSKQNPGKLNYADGAPLSTMVMHAIGERTGLTFTPIPYKGSAPSMTALVAGDIDMVLDTVPNYLQFINVGKVRPLMNTGRTRAQPLPEVVSGADVPGIDFSAASVLSFWAPPGTPDAIIQRLNAEIKAIVSNPDFVAKFRSATQTEPSASTPAELLKLIDSDKALYGQIAKKIGYEAQ